MNTAQVAREAAERWHRFNLAYPEIAERALHETIEGVAADGWRLVSDELPAIGEVVWLWDGDHIWIGAREFVDSEDWLWCKCYSSPWFIAGKWDGDLEADDDYKPAHWKTLPNPPNK